MKAVILAGGFGTRVKSIAKDVPKPMISIGGKPFLEHLIEFLKDHNIVDIIITVHHMANKIKSYFSDGGRFNVRITYSEEDTPLGTAGAIKKAEKYLNETFIVMNGDSYSDIDLNKLIEFHKTKKSKSTMVLTRSADSILYGSTILQEGKITGFYEKSHLAEGLVNTGIYVFEPEILSLIEPNREVSLEREIFPKIVSDGSLLGYVHEGYFMDIGRPETYYKFKESIINSLILRSDSKVRDAMNKISKNKINIVLVADGDKKLLGVLNERMIREYILKGGEINDMLLKAMTKDPIVARTSDGQEKILELLRSGIYHLPIIDDLGIIRGVEFYSEIIKDETFPILRGRAPLRISFAGGGTDLPYFFDKYGGVVINATINKFCHATIIKRADSKIIINSDLDEELILDLRDNIVYNGKFDLIKAIIKVAKPDFGFEIYLHNDLPPGRGLGSSASLAVLLITLISSLQNIQYDDYKIAEMAYKAEREELGIKGGWQDQYAAVTGGFNYMEFNENKTIIYPLRLKEEVINELKSHLLLCYVGKAHQSGEVHKSQEERFRGNEFEMGMYLNDMKAIAVKMKDSLLTNELNQVGKLLHESWINKRALSKSISDSSIDALYEVGLKNGALGGKLLGAGSGGYILFFCSPTKRNQLSKALKSFNGEVTDFNFEFSGTKTWSVKTKF